MREERDAALAQIGELSNGIPWTRDMVQLDHQPALVFRERTTDGGFIPTENDPAFMRFMLKADHAVKTHGTAATSAGSDIHMAAKVKRILKKRNCSEILDSSKPKIKRAWPSRPFPKKAKT
jgi:hypothetical protein